MMKRNRLWLLLFILLPITAVSQIVEIRSVAEAESLAIAHNGWVNTIRSEALAADARTESVERFGRTGVGYVREGMTSGGRFGEQRIEVSQGLVLPGYFRAEKNLLDSRKNEVLVSVSEREREIRSAVRSQWIHLWYASARKTVLERQEQLAIRLLELVEKRLDAGEIPAWDVARAQLSLNVATQAVLAADREQKAAESRLREVIGLSGNVQAVLPEAFVIPATVPSSDEIREGLAGHPAVRLARSQSETARLAARLESAARYPEINVSYLLQDFGGGFTDHGVIVGLRFNLNKRARNARVRASQAEAAASEIKAATALFDLTTQLQGDFTRFESVRQSLAQLTDSEEPVVALLADKAETGYNLGELSLLDVLDARRMVLEVQLVRIQLTLEYYTLLIGIESYSGTTLWN